MQSKGTRMNGVKIRFTNYNWLSMLMQLKQCKPDLLQKLLVKFI